MQSNRDTDMRIGPRVRVGRALIGTVLLLTIPYALLSDISASHLFNPGWHPHARFHLAQMLAMLCIDMALGVWLLVRPATDYSHSIGIACVLALAFWTPILWITSVVPGTDLHAGAGIPLPVINGVRIYLNVVAAILAMTCTLVGWLLVRSSLAGQHRRNRTPALQ